jgi:hypothetical protein
MSDDLKNASMGAVNNEIATIHPSDAGVSSSEHDSDGCDDQDSEQISKRRKSNQVRIPFDPEMENPNEKAALNSDDVFFDMKPRWRRAFMQELHRRDSAKNRNDMILLCPDDDCKPPEELIDEDDGADKISSKGALVPKSPTFRQGTKTSQGSGKGDSPCGVDNFESGRVYFWQRSLAWSEDGEDTPKPYQDQDDVRNHLSVPEKLGREYADDNQFVPQKSLRQLSLENNVRSKGHSTPISFQRIDMDATTRIHWEEKVLDASDLEMIAKLSI